MITTIQENFSLVVVRSCFQGQCERNYYYLGSCRLTFQFYFKLKYQLHGIAQNSFFVKLNKIREQFVIFLCCENEKDLKARRIFDTMDIDGFPLFSQCNVISEA